MHGLIKFLLEAKKHTWSSGAVEEVFCDGTHHLEYTSGNFRYTDNFRGFNPFIGQELVWENGQLVWGMNYFGGTYTEAAALVKPKEIYHFLKLALQHIPEDAPFRGPRLLKDGNFAYYNHPAGSVAGFHGTEQIKWIGERQGELIPYRLLYALTYHGGLLTQGGLQFRPNLLQ